MSLFTNPPPPPMEIGRSDSCIIPQGRVKCEKEMHASAFKIVNFFNEVILLLLFYPFVVLVDTEGIWDLLFVAHSISKESNLDSSSMPLNEHWL